MSRTEYFTLISLQDGLPLSMVQVAPEGEIRALVQLAHGMSEHKERYLPFMQFLAERGCLCVMNDHRGHGASARSDDQRSFPGSDADHALVEDLHQITQWMRRQHPGKKLFLLGHSMGSLAARAYCEEHAGQIDGLLLSGSPARHPALGPGLLLIRVLQRFLGPEYRNPRLQDLVVGGYARKFPEHRYAWLSSNMDNVLAFADDPLCRFTYSLSGLEMILQLMRRAYGLKQLPPDLPVRFYSGAEDPCAMGQRGFERAVQAMRRAGCRDVQGHMFPGMRHEILNEGGRQQVFERIWREGIQPYL